MELPASLLEQHIGRGTILHSTTFKDIDHGKFFLVIGVSEDRIAGFFFINSNINKALLSKPEQFEMQYLIKHSDYDFLNYDSFVCATNINKIPIERLVSSIVDGDTKIVAQMKEEHIAEILEATRKSRLFSKEDKQKYFMLS